MARFLLSKSRLWNQYRQLEPLGIISYSLKTNHAIGKLLEQEKDCWFSVHTLGELAFVQDKTRVWFLAESWTVQEIQDLVKQGVTKFVVHNANDLAVLMEALNQIEAPVDLLLRVRLRENTIFTGKYYVFGFHSDEVNQRVKELRSHPRIGKLGIHFHRKTQNVSEWELRYAVEKMLAPETLQAIEYLSIGGGLPIAYKNSSDDQLPRIVEKIKELKTWLVSQGVELVLEPGRFLAGPPVQLEATVVNVVGSTVVVDCSVYNTAPDTLIMPLKLIIQGEGTGKKYTIKGMTPDSMDIFRYDVLLPEKRVGDTVVFENAGAYAFHTTFCSLEEVPTDIVQ